MYNRDSHISEYFYALWIMYHSLTDVELDTTDGNLCSGVTEKFHSRSIAVQSIAIADDRVINLHLIRL